MSGKSRALTVAAATATLIGLWVPAALASTVASPVSANNTGAVSANNSGLINGGLINSGPVNVSLGSGNTAIGNTCNNNNESGALAGNLLTWPVNLSQNSCLMAGGPAHF